MFDRRKRRLRTWCQTLDFMLRNWFHIFDSFSFAHDLTSKCLHVANRERWERSNYRWARRRIVENATQTSDIREQSRKIARKSIARRSRWLKSCSLRSRCHESTTSVSQSCVDSYWLIDCLQCMHHIEIRIRCAIRIHVRCQWMNELDENRECHECEFRSRLLAVVLLSLCVAFLDDFQWSKQIRNNRALNKQVDEMKNDSWDCKTSCRRSNETREFDEKNFVIESNVWVIVVDNQFDVLDFDVENCRLKVDELIAKYCKRWWRVWLSAKKNCKQSERCWFLWRNAKWFFTIMRDD